MDLSGDTSPGRAQANRRYSSAFMFLFLFYFVLFFPQCVLIFPQQLGAWALAPFLAAVKLWCL